MPQKEVTIQNKTGLHARPASLFVKKANEFDADINLEVEGKEANAKSIMGVMSLGAAKGKKLLISAEGNQAEEAVESLAEFVEKTLPEEDK